MARKAAVFIFKNPTNKDGPCSAKVIYETKEAATIAIAEFNRTSSMCHVLLSDLSFLCSLDKHIPQWNARLNVQISHPKSKKPNESKKSNPNTDERLRTPMCVVEKSNTRPGGAGKGDAKSDSKKSEAGSQAGASATAAADASASKGKKNNNE